MNEDRIVDIAIILGAITIVILKFTNVIQLSWFWLLSPLWILAGLGVIFCILITIAFIIHNIKYKVKENKDERS
jgi:membrane protein YdbS with pleckstrin-like domain